MSIEHDNDTNKGGYVDTIEFSTEKSEGKKFEEITACITQEAKAEEGEEEELAKDMRPEESVTDLGGDEIQESDRKKGIRTDHVRFKGEEQDGDARTSNQEKSRFQRLNIFDECRSMLASSIFVYALADIRRAARRGRVIDPEVAEAVLKLPLVPSNLLPLLVEKREKIQRYLGEGGDEFYLTLLTVEMNYYREQMSVEASNLQHDEIPTSVVVFEDENSDKEMVYGIVVNHVTKRIEIIFRGSVTARDFMVDVNPRMNSYPNPVQSVRGHLQDSSIGIQMGFAVYMNGTIQGLGEGKCKEIRDTVLMLWNENPSYQVYCTGHSLGGALATLEAFDLATTPEIPKPVKCINFASPKVGNIGFRHAIQALEKLGHLQVLRVVNQFDVIPELPTKACCCVDMACCCCAYFVSIEQSRRYWHAGAKVLLYENGFCDITYKRRSMTYREQIQQELSKGGRVGKIFKSLLCMGCCNCSITKCEGKGEVEILRNHSCKEYIRRMVLARAELSSKYLSELYFKESRRSIMVLVSPVGNLQGKG